MTPNQCANAVEAIAAQPEKFRHKMQTDLRALGKPNTGNPRLTEALRRHLPLLLESQAVAVPNDPEEMRWRLFFAHSQDMLGFRADIFTGGPNEADHPTDKAYRGLRDKWPDGKTMLSGLAELWQNPDGRKTLEAISNKFRPASEKAKGIAPALALLRGPLGNAATRIFADAYEELKGANISHKNNAIVRAYCQNAAVLAPYDYCFQAYLRSVADPFLPSDDITDEEKAWVQAIQRDFYNVGPALAPYLVADWLLHLWLDGQVSWFSLYKPDSVFLQSAGDYLPPEATQNEAAFISYCRTLRLPPEWIPGRLWHVAFYNIVPRIINEVVWLDNNKSTPLVMPIGAMPPAAQPINSALKGKNTMLSPSDIRPFVKTVLESAQTSLTSYEILEQLPAEVRDQLIAERGLPGAGSGSNYSAASLVTQAVEKLLPAKEPPYRVYENFTGKTFMIAGKTIVASGVAIATYRLSASNEDAPEGVLPVVFKTIWEPGTNQTDAFTTVNPSDYKEHTLTPQGEEEDPFDPRVLVVSTVDTELQQNALGEQSFDFAPLTATTEDKKSLWVAFTSREAMRLAVGERKTKRQNMRLSALVDLFLTLQKMGLDDIDGIILDPSGPNPHRLSPQDMAHCLKDRLSDEQAKQLFSDTKLPAHAANGKPTAQTAIVCAVRETDEIEEDGSPAIRPAPVALKGGMYLVAYTSIVTSLRGTENLPLRQIEKNMTTLCNFYFSKRAEWNLAGIILNPFEETEQVLGADEIKTVVESTVEQTPIKTENILKISPPLMTVSASGLSSIRDLLHQAKIQEAWALSFTYLDMSETLMIYFRPFNENKIGPLWHRINEVVQAEKTKNDAPADVAFGPLDDKAESLAADYGEKLLPLQNPPKKKIGFLGR